MNNIIKFEEYAIEESSFIIESSFYDEEENLVAPTEIKWTLTDEFGNIVNNRENVVVDSLASVISIILQGDDLKCSTTLDEKRVITIYWTYDSDLGDDIPMYTERQFVIKNLLNVI